MNKSFRSSSVNLYRSLTTNLMISTIGNPNLTFLMKDFYFEAETFLFHAKWYELN